MLVPLSCFTAYLGMTLLAWLSCSSAFHFVSFLDARRSCAHPRFETSCSSSSSSSNIIEGSLSSSIVKKDLLSLIPNRPFGAPATNITTDEKTVEGIRNLATALEYLTPLPPLVKSKNAVEALDGVWQLVYSDASEITRISQLPLGFRLGPVFQPIHVTSGRLENQALVKHKLLLGSGHTRVMAKFEFASLGDINRVGVVNVGERVNVKFQKAIFTLRRFLLLPTFGKIRKTAIPNGPSEQKGVTPCLDITYLDDTMRISRGGDGSLFILIRPPRQTPMPMLDVTKESIVVDNNAPTYDASVDILPTGSRD